jgi:hypothetical protein
LQISGAAPKLAGMLFKRSLEGSSFLDLIPDPLDVDRLRNAINVAPHQKHAELCNVHLRDADGTIVPVEVFCSSFEDLDGELEHVIGICEIGSRSQTKDDIIQPDNFYLPGMVSFCDVGSKSAKSRSSSSSKSKLSRTPKHVRTEDAIPPLAALSSKAGPPAVSVEFDVFSEDFTILESSIAFGLLVGQTPVDSNLACWIVDQRAFREWVQEHANAVLNSHGTRSKGTLKVAFRPPLATDLGVEFVASCHLALPPGKTAADAMAEIEETDALPMTLSMSKVRCRELSCAKPLCP